MVTTVRSLGLNGIAGYEVTAECFLSGGLPAFDIVGLPDAAVREARERVRAAVKNCGAKFPVSRITVNLAPAGTKKAGTVYDLPIFVGLLAADGNLPAPPKDAAFIGELSLTGALRGVSGVLPMALAAREAGIRTLYVPADNAAEATLAEGLTVYGVPDVGALVAHLKNETLLSPAPVWVPEPEETGLPDLQDVMGQEHVKRALEIAAAGGHNLLLIGSPGAGKSMLAKRLPSILPELSRPEALETSGIWSVAGLTDPRHPLLTQRPVDAARRDLSGPQRCAVFGRAAGISPGRAGGSPSTLGGRHRHRGTGRRHPAAPRPIPAGVRHESLQVRLAGPPLREMHLLGQRGGEVRSEDLRSSAGPDRPPCKCPLCGIRGHAAKVQAGILRSGQGAGGRRPGHDRVLRVARTIADLDGAEHIGVEHLSEAIQYRNTDILKG